MTKNLYLDAIHVKDLNLWAHVGVLEKERLLGQAFMLDFSVWIDLEVASRNDDLSKTIDYSIAIVNLQKLSSEIKCQTIEQFSEQILDLIEKCYGELPIRILLKKCSPPIKGFDGSVAIEKKRNFLDRNYE